MARSSKSQPKPADWSADQTLRVLRRQLADLEKLKGRSHREAHQAESVWSQVTQAAIIHGFGEESHNLSHFYHASRTGIHNIMGVSDHQQQLNFQKRIEAYEATVTSSIAELEASLPDAALKGSYEAGDEFAFYRDFKDIVAAGTKDIFIVDNYLNTEFFELYVEPVRAGVPVRILTDEVRGNLLAVAKKYATRGSFELRSSAEVHDRHVFVDGRGWMIGQSIKDAARKKPTSVVEFGAGIVPVVQKIYEEIWARATVVVKG
jgi:hypothetical protein